jgi:hypothetical protein
MDRIPLARWGQGRVTLLGDAAHPTTPNLGQGACQAIEDAVVLAASLADDPPRGCGSAALRAGTFSTHNRDYKGFLAVWECRPVGKPLWLLVAEPADLLDPECGFIAIDGKQSKL